MASPSVLAIMALAVLLLNYSPAKSAHTNSEEEATLEEMPLYEDGDDDPFYAERRGFLTSSRLGKRYRLAKKGFLTGSRLG